jgi:hypothetical protein
MAVAPLSDQEVWEAALEVVIMVAVHQADPDTDLDLPEDTVVLTGVTVSHTRAHLLTVTVVMDHLKDMDMESVEAWKCISTAAANTQT